MLESFKDKRAIFPVGKQRLFIEHCARRGLTIPKLARIAKCSERTMRDWRREKFPMNLAALHRICTRARIPVPDGITVRDSYAHAHDAGIKGGRAIIEKYGRIPVEEQYRKQRWLAWWEANGKMQISPYFRSKAISIPKIKPELAEFIGIMMGDGGMSDYQISITLHHVNDRLYSHFVVNLIKKLFRLKPSVYHHENDSVYSIVVSRKELVLHLHSLGLPIGNKVRQQLDIPLWIKKSRKFAVACVRGLVDTDGCIFTHSYAVKGRIYHYKKLSFTSHSDPLLKSVASILFELGMRPRVTRYNVRLDSKDDMKKYFSLIGSHNPKHLKRFRK